MQTEVDNFRVIERAYGTNIPISPKPLQAYMLALILGMCIPPAFVWTRMQLKRKVETKTDVENTLKGISILAVVPKSGSKDYALIPENGRDLASDPQHSRRDRFCG